MKTQLLRYGLERHVQTAIQIILVALILWSGQSTLEIKDKVARLEEQFRAVQKDLAIATNDRYTASQATRDFDNLSRRMASLEKQQEDTTEWMRNLRDRYIALEADVRNAGLQRRPTLPPQR